MVGMRLPFLRKAATGDEPLVVSMSGARLGDTVVFAGQSASLVLPLAARTGLSGRCLVVGFPEATAALEATATREGLLVETADRFPADRSFELAVVEAVGEWVVRGRRRARCRPRRRPDHRRRRRRRARAAVRDSAPDLRRSLPSAIVETLARQGWQRPRAIGGRDGLLFVEAFA